MKILRTTPNPSGAYPPIQSWDGVKPPNGYAEIACDTAVFYAFRGFVTPTLTDGKVTGMTGNQAALDAYLAEHSDTEVNSPTPDEDRDALIIDHEYRLTLLELGVTE